MLGFETYRSPQDSEKKGVSRHPLKFDMPADEWAKIKRADLIFEGVDHIGDSYEVRVFFNNKKASAKTSRTAENGYAGRFVVFGHGQCFGADGHCDARVVVHRSHLISAATQVIHPATPHRRILTVTKPLNRIIKRYKKGLHTLTLVTTLKSPRRSDRKAKSGLFKCKRISIQAYS